jgi:hypothetical protein
MILKLKKQMRYNAKIRMGYRHRRNFEAMKWLKLYAEKLATLEEEVLE